MCPLFEEEEDTTEHAMIWKCVKKVLGKCPSEEGIGQVNELRASREHMKLRDLANHAKIVMDIKRRRGLLIDLEE